MTEISLDIERPIQIDVEITAPTVPTVALVITPGPPGPPGPAFDGTAWWYGEGPPPELLVGSKVGDIYMDTLTGVLYQLNMGV